jgi:Leucine-rich repeat (LRR) protein
LTINNGVSGLSLLGVEKLTNLTTCNIINTNVSDISALTKLTKLTTLNLSNNKISSLSKLGDKKALTSLNLSNNIIEDITPLSGTITYSGDSDKTGSIQYTTLDLTSNSISATQDNLNILKKLHNAGLQSVILTSNPIANSEEYKNELINIFGSENVTF